MDGKGHGRLEFEYQEVVLISTIFVWDVATNGAVDYHEWAYEHTLWPPTGKEYRPGVTSDFDGARVHTANLSAGLHKASCQLDGSGGEDYYTTFRRSRST